MANPRKPLTELTSEELIKVIDEKNIEIEAKNSEIASKNSELVLKDAEIKAKDQKLADNETDLKTSEDYIAELKEVLAAKDNEVPTINGSPVVKVGSDSYEIVILSFNLDGEKYSAADVVKNDKLASKLIKMGSGVLRKIEK